MLIAGFASNAKRIAVPTVEHGAFIHQNVVAGFDGLLFGLFHRMARSSGQGLAVVERNELEHDGGSVGSVDLSESLGATRARSTLDPDDRVQVALACADNRLFQSLGHARSGGFTQASHNRKRATQFHEATTRNTARFEHSLKL